MRSRTKQSEVRRPSGARHGASTPFRPTEKELLDQNWTIVFDLPSDGNSRHITLISRVTKSALLMRVTTRLCAIAPSTWLEVGVDWFAFKSAGEPNSGHGCTAVAATTVRRIKRGLAWNCSTLLHQRGSALAESLERHFKATKLLRD